MERAGSASLGPVFFFTPRRTRFFEVRLAAASERGPSEGNKLRPQKLPSP